MTETGHLPPEVVGELWTFARKNRHVLGPEGDFAEVDGFVRQVLASEAATLGGNGVVWLMVLVPGTPQSEGTAFVRLALYREYEGWVDEVRELLRAMMSEVNVNRLLTEVPAGSPSEALFAQLGFVRVGCLRERCLHESPRREREDAVLFELIRSDFYAEPPKVPATQPPKEEKHHGVAHSRRRRRRGARVKRREHVRDQAAEPGTASPPAGT